MQIYTKILIGMAAGAVCGLLLGPRSALLEKDQVSALPAMLKLTDAPGGRPNGVALPPLPGNGRVQLRLLATHRAKDLVYHKVSLRVSERLALADSSGRLKRGTVVSGWVDVKAAGLGAPVSTIGATLIGWLSPIGEAFLKLIKMIVVPLVFASLLVGVASLGDLRRLGRLGGKTLAYFLLTTFAAITIGVTIASVVKPGNAISAKDKTELLREYKSSADEKAEQAAKSPSAAETIIGIIPVNPAESMATGNMLQIIFFALIFGIALTLLEQQRVKPVIAFFETVNDAMIVVVNGVMKLAPYGVFALVAQVVGQSGLSVLQALLVYALVVLAGLAVQAFAVYSSVVRVIGKIRTIDFWRAARPAQLIAFSSSSSSATLPVTMRVAEERLGVSRQVSSFVLPLGSTINMDGTALYQGVAAIFIAQVFNMPLGLMDMVTIVLTATLASIGAAGVPGVGMITLTLVLTTVGVPTTGVALILGMDRILDMFRTAINVTGDLSAAVIVSATEGESPRYQPQ